MEQSRGRRHARSKKKAGGVVLPRQAIIGRSRLGYLRLRTMKPARPKMPVEKAIRLDGSGTGDGHSIKPKLAILTVLSV